MRALHLKTSAVAALVLVAAGCTGGSDEEAAVSEETDPAEVLELAAQTLRDTSGVQIELTTDDLPEGVTGITQAAGIGTSQPAFEGSITVVLLGNSVNVPVTSVDGTVYAVIPLTEGYQEVDPAEYGAPDPAQLVGPEGGFAELLSQTTDIEAGESVRGGANNDEIVTEYTGTVPGTAAEAVIPSATGEFEATYSITDDGELREAVLTGAFYGDDGENTYTIDFDEYGVDQEIVAP